MWSRATEATAALFQAFLATSTFWTRSECLLLSATEILVFSYICIIIGIPDSAYMTVVFSYSRLDKCWLNDSITENCLIVFAWSTMVSIKYPLNYRHYESKLQWLGILKKNFSVRETWVVVIECYTFQTLLKVLLPLKLHSTAFLVSTCLSSVLRDTTPSKLPAEVSQMTM